VAMSLDFTGAALKDEDICISLVSGAADIIHDSRHSEQFARGLSYNGANAIPMEREASLFTLGVIDNIGGWIIT